MLIVLHFCDKDGALALEDLRWAKELDDRIDYECLLSYDETTRAETIRQCVETARAVFKTVHEFRYPTPPVKGWPAAPNWAWQNTARYIPTAFKDHWFWWEADAIPVRSGWCKILDDAYKREGRPFGGHIVQGVVTGGHMNGVGIYPNQVDRYTLRALMCQNQAWDVVMAEEAMGETGDISLEIQHLWGITNGKPDHTGGEPAHFRELQNVYNWVDLNAAVVHRVKDDSLIKWLRHIRSPEHNVPMLTPIVESAPAPAPIASTAVQPTEIFIVTFAKDLPWLQYCLRSVKKFCTGFTGVTLVVPSDEKSFFKQFQLDAKLVTFNERPGKGMVHHMAIECMADKLVSNAECVLHLDADTIFNGPTDVSQFFRNGKPIYVWRTYESLYDQERKVNSDCVIWKERTERALGFKTDVYGMCVMPCINSMKLFPQFRQWIEQQHGMPFVDWATQGQNAFPQDWSEYSALGAFAKELMPDLYHWLNCAVEAVPKENSYHFHSHSGLTPKIREQIEGWLK